MEISVAMCVITFLFSFFFFAYVKGETYIKVQENLQIGRESDSAGRSTRIHTPSICGSC